MVPDDVRDELPVPVCDGLTVLVAVDVTEEDGVCDAVTVLDAVDVPV
jgi:hypothetical protein